MSYDKHKLEVLQCYSCCCCPWVCWTVRYRIYEYNVDDLVLCILPHHDTESFVRILQMISLGRETSKWHWLEPCVVGKTWMRSVISGQTCSLSFSSVVVFVAWCVSNDWDAVDSHSVSLSLSLSILCSLSRCDLGPSVVIHLPTTVAALLSLCVLSVW